MCLDLKSAKWGLKPLCSGYRIWWSLRNWLGTRLCRGIVCQHLLQRYLEALSSVVRFSLTPSHPSYLGSVFPTAQFHISSADIQIQDRLIVSSDGTCYSHTLPKLLPRRQALGIIISQDWCLFSFPSSFLFLCNSSREDDLLSTVAKSGKHLLLCLLKQNQWTYHSV